MVHRPNIQDFNPLPSTPRKAIGAPLTLRPPTPSTSDAVVVKMEPGVVFKVPALPTPPPTRPRESSATPQRRRSSASPTPLREISSDFPPSPSPVRGRTRTPSALVWRSRASSVVSSSAHATRDDYEIDHPKDDRPSPTLARIDKSSALQSPARGVTPSFKDRVGSVAVSDSTFTLREQTPILQSPFQTGDARRRNGARVRNYGGIRNPPVQPIPLPQHRAIPDTAKILFDRIVKLNPTIHNLVFDSCFVLTDDKEAYLSSWLLDCNCPLNDYILPEAYDALRGCAQYLFDAVRNRSRQTRTPAWYATCKSQVVARGALLRQKCTKKQVETVVGGLLEYWYRSTQETTEAFRQRIEGFNPSTTHDCYRILHDLCDLIVGMSATSKRGW
ncbi:hypothetical protein P7C73_g1685, partial [Tremellales sp. Uapishka_1]